MGISVAGINQQNPNTVLAGPATGAAASSGPVSYRTLVAADFSAAKVIAGLSALIRIAAGTSSITGITGGAINTGLSTVTQVIVSLAGPASSGVAGVTGSAIASSGWFSASVFGVTSTAGGVFVSTAAGIVSWIAVGT